MLISSKDTLIQNYFLHAWLISYSEVSSISLSADPSSPEVSLLPSKQSWKCSSSSPFVSSLAISSVVPTAPGSSTVISFQDKLMSSDIKLVEYQCTEAELQKVGILVSRIPDIFCRNSGHFQMVSTNLKMFSIKRLQYCSFMTQFNSE